MPGSAKGAAPLLRNRPKKRNLTPLISISVPFKQGGETAVGVFKDLDPVDLQQWLDGRGGALTLIDVRTPAEVARGAIQGARSMPLHLLPLNLSMLDKGHPLVFYCQSGGRSQQACMFVQQQGYENIYNLRGGILAWQRCGLPVGVLSS